MDQIRNLSCENSPNQWRLVITDIPIFKCKRKFSHVCRNCGRAFFSGSTKSTICGYCFFEFKCNHCNKFIPFPNYKLYALDFSMEFGCKEYCHVLGARKKQAPGICSRCGKHVEKRDQFCFGYSCGCHKKVYIEHNQSEAMRKIEKENGIKYGPKNLVRYNKSTQGREKSAEIIRNVNKAGLNSFIGSEEQKSHLLKLNFRSLEFCDVCKALTVHDGFHSCLICNPRLTNANFIENNGILYYFDNSIQDYIPWVNYKAKFKIKNDDWKLPEGFRFIPTFRDQSSTSWEGARGAFEQFLVDEGIGWFVYIKFYVSAEKRILPLVVGKSGSLLVNASGSDLSFSTDVEDGPARRFLAEESLEWCKTQIAILPCISEQNALNKEKENKEKFNLFYS